MYSHYHNFYNVGLVFTDVSPYRASHVVSINYAPATCVPCLIMDKGEDSEEQYTVSKSPKFPQQQREHVIPPKKQI